MHVHIMSGLLCPLLHSTYLGNCTGIRKQERASHGMGMHFLMTGCVGFLVSQYIYLGHIYIGMVV